MQPSTPRLNHPGHDTCTHWRWRQAITFCWSLLTKSWLPGLLLLGLAQAQVARADSDFLPVDQAFAPSLQLQGQQLSVHWQIAPGYFLYRERISLIASDASGAELQALPAPEFSQAQMKDDPISEQPVAVFHQAASLIQALPAGDAPLRLKLSYQGCAEAGLCYPPQKRYFWLNPASGELHPLGEANALASAIQTNDHADAKAAPMENAATADDDVGLLKALLMALLGGIVLNLMPCVFPVLSLKLMSLTQTDAHHLKSHGWAYTLGSLASFVAIASVLLAARAGGQAIGWGFQLQSPLVLAGLVYLFLLMGLSLSGWLLLGGGLMGIGQGLTQKPGLSGSFFTGILAALVASPCTAPFMGAALGFALTQPALVGLWVFAALGLGMALPMLLLCHWPWLAQRLPKPGLWMEQLKELLAFPLYLTALWLLWVLGHQAGVDGVIATAAGALLLIFAIWLHKQAAARTWQILKLGAIGACLLGSLNLPWQQLRQAQAAEPETRFSLEQLDKARASGRPVFVNLTADWCLTCLTNERVALDTQAVQKAFAQQAVITIKGDWTQRDPQITEMLSHYKRSGVPLYIWFPAGSQGDGQVLPQILTQAMLLELVGKAQATQARAHVTHAADKLFAATPAAGENSSR